jgi:hypothetical protein
LARDAPYPRDHSEYLRRLEPDARVGRELLPEPLISIKDELGEVLA